VGLTDMASGLEAGVVRQIGAIVLFSKSIQPSRRVDACGFQPIICMSTIMYCG
jgi:hypothetical protein